MSGQLHITHRGAYLRGREQGKRDAVAGCDCRPRDGATGTADQQRAYGIGYEDGYAAGIEETCSCTSERFCAACYKRACAES